MRRVVAGGTAERHNESGSTLGSLDDGTHCGRMCGRAQLHASGCPDARAVERAAAIRCDRRARRARHAADRRSNRRGCMVEELERPDARFIDCPGSGIQPGPADCHRPCPGGSRPAQRRGLVAVAPDRLVRQLSIQRVESERRRQVVRGYRASQGCTEHGLELGGEVDSSRPRCGCRADRFDGGGCQDGDESSASLLRRAVAARCRPARGLGVGVSSTTGGVQAGFL